MDPIHEIKAALDIADIVGEYLPLKPSGTGTFKANCPFHQERTPSFYVSRPRQTWHCFGCNEGGDIFTFVQKMEGMGFREVLQQFAQRTGIALPVFERSQDTGVKSRLIELHELAKRFYRSQLEQSPQAELARVYVKKRGLDILTMDLFGIGYAPDEWSSFSDHAIKQGYTEQELVAAGLANKREQKQGIYDRFRGRMMFPIWDVQGHCIGFTARILTDAKDQPKYINTPETVLYRKSHVLYGLDKAKGAIRQHDLAVIVEGNMDVIASQQYGVMNVVASSGTALTQEQLGLIKRFTTNIAIAFDQDAAGITATLRGLDIARAQDFSIRIIQLPAEAGKDPDEAVRKDPQLWKDAIASAIPIMDWVYRMAFKKFPATTPEGKKELVKFLLPELARIADPIEKDHWLRTLAKDLDTSLSVLEQLLIKRKKEGVPQPLITQKEEVSQVAMPEPRDPELLAIESQEERVMTILISLKQEIATIISSLTKFEEKLLNPEHKLLYKALVENYTQPRPEHSQQSTPTSLVTGIHPPVNLGPEEMKAFNHLAFIAERDFQGQALDLLKRELQKDVAALQERLKKYQRRQLEQHMREAERLHDTERMNALLTQFQELT